MRLFLQQTSSFTLLYSNRKTNLENIFLDTEEILVIKGYLKYFRFNNDINDVI